MHCCLYFITMYFLQEYFHNFKFYIKIIFNCIFATGFKHLFFSISFNSSLENDFCVKDRKLGPKN